MKTRLKKFHRDVCKKACKTIEYLGSNRRARLTDVDFRNVIKLSSSSASSLEEFGSGVYNIKHVQL